jgi:hypothetical protein
LEKAGITDGLWTIGVNFNIGVALTGVEPDLLRPSAVVSIDRINLARASEPGPLTYDAAAIAAKRKKG